LFPLKESYSLEMCFKKCNNVYLESIYFAVLKITSELIMRIHREAIDGGKEEEQSLRDAIRDEGCIQSICYGDDFEDPFKRASYFLHRIATRHPFFEGNKRTAFMVAAIIIYFDTEYIIENDNDENDRFVRDVASDLVEEEEIKKWLKDHVIRSEI